ASDVRHTICESGGDELLDHVQIAAVSLHQCGPGFFLDCRDVLRWLVSGNVEHELASQRVAVGVEAGGWESDKNVRRLDGGAGDELVTIDRSNDESGQIVLAFGIEARHLRGFAANEGTAVGAAGFGEAGDYRLGDLGIQLAAGEVVEEEKRGGALN